MASLWTAFHSIKAILRIATLVRLLLFRSQDDNGPESNHQRHNHNPCRNSIGFAHAKPSLRGFEPAALAHERVTRCAAGSDHHRLDDRLSDWPIR